RLSLLALLPEAAGPHGVAHGGKGDQRRQADDGDERLHGPGLVPGPRLARIAEGARPCRRRCEEHDDGCRSPRTDVATAERPVPPLPAHPVIVLGGGLAGSRHYDGRMPLFGTPVVRREDARLLTGGAQYVSNLDIPGAAHV